MKNEFNDFEYDETVDYEEEELDYEDDELDYEDDELSEEEKYEDARRMMYPNSDDEEFEEEMLDRLFKD